jgi:hypothetical protein
VCSLAADLTERFVCALPRSWWAYVRATPRRTRYCEPAEPIQAGARPRLKARAAPILHANFGGGHEADSGNRWRNEGVLRLLDPVLS